MSSALSGIWFIWNFNLQWSLTTTNTTETSLWCSSLRNSWRKEVSQNSFNSLMWIPYLTEYNFSTFQLSDVHGSLNLFKLNGKSFGKKSESLYVWGLTQNYKTGKKCRDNCESCRQSKLVVLNWSDKFDIPCVHCLVPTQNMVKSHTNI